ncbi:DUF1045 domain-containing protein [Sagittula sp. SSi028]|uniref:DUF1045 domain-containing protein n=1 Tax=Sagittula sp. SSi028 TaxID=3400636 RepID=UPI003AF6DDCE
MSYTRFAVYWMPEGALAEFGARWLGWDALSGQPADQFAVPGLDDATMTPRKYGFHGTLKPPFRLADGVTQADVQAGVAKMAASLAPAAAEGLSLTPLGRFLALTPDGDNSGIARVAATCVKALDAFRAPLSDADLERRRKAGLSEAQEALLLRWGYPYVMEQFRFHLTLTGKLHKRDLPLWADHVAAHLPDLPRPFVLDQVALVGERPDGRFELIHRYALTG